MTSGAQRAQLPSSWMEEQLGRTEPVRVQGPVREGEVNMRMPSSVEKAKYF